MDKKFYLEPEVEIVDLELNGALLAGSPTDPDEDTGEAPKSDTEI